jgi:hypothetical protein
MTETVQLQKPDGAIASIASQPIESVLDLADANLQYTKHPLENLPEKAY